MGEINLRHHDGLSMIFGSSDESPPLLLLVGLGSLFVGDHSDDG